MTEHLRSFLQWCTTRDWLHPHIQEHTLQQAGMCAIYDEEIEGGEGATDGYTRARTTTWYEYGATGSTTTVKASQH